MNLRFLVSSFIFLYIQLQRTIAQFSDLYPCQFPTSYPYQHDEFDSGISPCMMISEMQSPYMQSPFMQSPYMQSSYMQIPYHNIQEDYYHSPFMQSPFMQSPFMQSPFIQSPFIQSPFMQSPYIQSPFMQSPYMQSPYQYMQSPYHHINEDYRQNSLMKMLPMLLMDKIKLAKTNNNVFNNLAGAGVIQVSQRNSKDDWARVTPPNSQIGKNINFQDYVRKDYAVAKLDKINKQISNYIMKRNEDMFNHYHH